MWKRVAAGVAGALLATTSCGITSGYTGQYYDATSHIWVMWHKKLYRVTVEMIATGAVKASTATEATSYNMLDWAIVTIAPCRGTKCARTTPYVTTLGSFATSPTPLEYYDTADATKLRAGLTGWQTQGTVTWQGPGPGSAPVDTGNAGMKGYNLDGSSSWKATGTWSIWGATCTDHDATVVRHTEASPLGHVPPVGKPLGFIVGPGVPTGKVTCFGESK